MLARLNIEWLKLKHYKTFWILSILYIISIFGANYIVLQIMRQIYADKVKKGMAEMIMGSQPYDFPIVWQMSAYVSSFLLFIPGLLIIISITNEYAFKTHRQNIIDGWSRRQFITVKLALTLFIAVISTFCVFLSALFFGMSGDKPLSFEGIHYIGYFFIQALSYSLAALLFSLLFKRGGLAIGVFFLYSLVLENLLAGLLNRYANNIGRYLPLESNDNLIPLPVFEKLQQELVEPHNYTYLLIAAGIYLLLYYIFINRKFATDDL